MFLSEDYKDYFVSGSSLRGLRAFAVIALMACCACKSHPKFTESQLPLPPASDSGVTNGEYVQVEYGFSFPVPAKWFYVKLSADQEVDEVARFSDPLRQILVRVTVRLLGPSEDYSAKNWGDMAEQDLKNHLFKIVKRESSKDWKTPDSGPWTEIPFHLSDNRGMDWLNEEWVLRKGDLLIGVHAFLPKRIADTDKGKKMFKALEGALTQIHWYTPLGSRGISLERYELRHFTEGFRAALESRTPAKISPFFDEMYPDRAKWNNWYQQVNAGDPASFELKAELSGLVINGDYASATFTLTRKDKGSSKPQKYDRSFRLSKKEGNWEIASSLDKN